MRAARCIAVVLMTTAVVAAGPAAVEAATATIAPSAVAVGFHQVASGFSAPVSVTSARDGSGRLFVVEQSGVVRVVKKGAVQSKAYLNISSEVQSGGEQGLLSIVFHPHFASHPFVYAAYTVSTGALHVSRFHATSATATSVAASTERHILAVAHPTYQNHNGGS
jgi:glucose/arabinose dehydrogenase